MQVVTNNAILCGSALSDPVMPSTTCPHCCVNSLTVQNSMCVGESTSLQTVAPCEGVTQESGSLVTLHGTADQNALTLDPGNLHFAHPGTDVPDARITSDQDLYIDAPYTATLNLGTAAGPENAANINIGTSDSDRQIAVGHLNSNHVTVDAQQIQLRTAGSGGISLETLNTSTGDIKIDSDEKLLLDADGVLELNSSGAAINIGNDAVAQNINVGTGPAARIITVGNTTGATEVNVNLGTGGMTVTGGTLNANGGIACDTDKFTVADTSGNTAIAGTLNVTGDTTLTGTLNANGGVTGPVTLTVTDSVPASASAPGTAGQIVYDDNYIYICTATDTWKRVPVSSW